MTDVRIAVARLELTPSIPIFAWIEVNAARMGVLFYRLPPQIFFIMMSLKLEKYGFRDIVTIIS